jgi:hypothetical protein
MTYVTLCRVPFGNGEVENLIWFCNLISQGPQKPYHAEALLEKLWTKAQIWPVSLERRYIHRLILKSYESAVKKHVRLNPNGPLPNSITYFPQYHTVRYRSSKLKVIITLDLMASVLLIQGFSRVNVLRYSSRVPGASAPVSVDTDRTLSPNEVCSFQISLGAVLDMF